MGAGPDNFDNGLRRRWRGVRRPVLAAVPVVVWVLVALLAFRLHREVRTVADVAGFADAPAVTLAHLEPGVVREVHVRLHDRVSRGQVLVSLDDSQERIQLHAVEQDVARLRAEVEAAKARLGSSNAWATADVDDLARRFAVDREAAHVEYLSQLAADARDRILLRGAEAECEIVKALHDQASAPFRELNDIVTEMDSLQTTIDRNAEVLARMQESFEEADQRWARFVEHAEVATSYEPVLTPLRLAIDVRRRDLEEIVRRMDAHVLRAPADGQVTVLLAHSGDSVQAGELLVQISPDATNRVLAYLPEQATLALSVGAPVSVTCLAASADGQRVFPGTIESLSTAVDEAPLRFRRIPSYPVWGRGAVVSLADGARLLPGEAVTVSLSEQP